MNKQQLYNLIDNPVDFNDDTLSSLQELVSQYPFFQAARLLLLKNLQALDHVLFEPELKKSALFLSDRTRLFELLRGHYPEKQALEKVTREEILEEDAHEAEEESPSSIAVTGKVESVNDYFGVDDVSETLQGGKVGFTFQADEDHSVPEELLFDYEKSDNAGYSLSLYEKERPEGNHSFEDWLSYVNDNQVKDEVAEENQMVTKKSKTFDVIDRFLNSDPVIRPQVPAGGSDDNTKTLETENLDSDELMTETLAKIYIKQGHYSKALKIFEKLSLKYPEKSVYFAQQIENVKKISSNQ